VLHNLLALLSRLRDYFSSSKALQHGLLPHLRIGHPASVCGGKKSMHVLRAIIVTALAGILMSCGQLPLTRMRPSWMSGLIGWMMRGEHKI
jgi:hypothetical protein